MNRRYLHALAHFTEFVGKSPDDLVEEVRKGEPTGEKERGLIELKIIQFYDWLTLEKPKEKPMQGTSLETF